MLSNAGLDLLKRFLTYDPKKRLSCEDGIKADYFKEDPVAIDPKMFPTWPAKSELGPAAAAAAAAAKKAASPKPPSGTSSETERTRMYLMSSRLILFQAEALSSRSMMPTMTSRARPIPRRPTTGSPSWRETRPQFCRVGTSSSKSCTYDFSINSST